MLELWTLCAALPLIMVFAYMKFHFNSSSRSGIIVRTKFERKNQQRAITEKICMLEFWPLCTALPFIMLFPHMKFHFNSSSSTGVIVRTRCVTDGQTDGQTDRQTDGQTDGQTTLTKTICLPHINMGGDIINTMASDLQEQSLTLCMPVAD